MTNLIGLSKYLDEQEARKNKTVDLEEVFLRYENKEAPEVVNVTVVKRGL